MLFFLTVIFLFEPSLAQFDRSGCGSLKGCTAYPTGCIQTGNCRLYFSYVQDMDVLAIEIYGQQTAPNQYYAIGFSNDQAMGDDTVVFCRTVNGITQAGLAYNIPNQKGNEIMNVQNVQAVSQATLSNGGLYCALRQRLNPGIANVKNLNEAFYILVASGTVQQDGRLGYHNQDRAVLARVDLRQYVKSGNTVIVNPIQGTSVEPFSFNRPLKDWMKIIHAICMIVGWGLFLSTGILFARHFKHHWPESKFCGVKLWFAYHRTLNTMGLILTILGVVAIFFAFDWQWMGWNPTGSSAENWSVGPLHCLFGAIASIIGWLQPIGALCRCKPESSARFIFNWLHRLVGLLGFLCAMTAITVTALYFNTMYYSMDVASSIWVAYLVVLIIVELIMEVLKIKRWCNGAISTGAEKEKEDGTPSRSDQMSGFSNAQSYVLLFYFIVALCLCTALSVLIFLKPVRAG